MKKEYGIIPDIPEVSSKGKVLSEDVKNLVREFWKSDEISRICPSAKDFLRIRNEEGIKESVQKRLVLMNLKEAFALYKSDETNPCIGFSTFAELRPKNCILAGASSTHSVCVCIYHQNAKLQFSALGLKKMYYKDLLEKAVCDVNNRNCMLQICKKFPKEKGVKDFLMSLETVTDKEFDNIKYKQWVSTDRCNLIENIEHFDQFIDSLCKKIVALTRHHFTAKKQSEFLKYLKENMGLTELIIVCDFSENYCFIIQDEIQGFHWVNHQCTLHPFVIYFKDPETNETKHESFCFLSPNTTHNTIMVYTFLKTLIPYLKNSKPLINKVHYFTDGSSAQYKNLYNFNNICKHMDDFALKCEWHFFASCHGKSSCDGIGAIVKRSVSKASLQRVFQKQILTPEDMFQYCNENLNKNIKFFYTSNDEIEAVSNTLQERFSKSIQVPGTRKYHKFVPLNENKIKAFELSFDVNGDEKYTQKTENEKSCSNPVDSKIGDFVVCTYNQLNWVGLVESYDEEFDDFGVSFLYPSGFNKFYYFPEKKDFCHVIAENILGILPTSNLKAGTTRIQYQFNEAELKSIMKL